MGNSSYFRFDDDNVLIALAEFEMEYVKEEIFYHDFFA